MPHKEHKRLHRLDDAFYRGRSYIHWTQTIGDRATGWLDGRHHTALRDILFHTCARFHLACPVYCLMPDHGHFLFIGLNERADQLAAIKWMRREWNALLDPRVLQDQAYDHVLRESDRERDAFIRVVGYILRNPVRKALADEWEDWPYSGAVFPGYPKLDPRKPYFWDNFWKAYHRQGDTGV